MSGISRVFALFHFSPPDEASTGLQAAARAPHPPAKNLRISDEIWQPGMRPLEAPLRKTPLFTKSGKPAEAEAQLAKFGLWRSR